MIRPLPQLLADCRQGEPEAVADLVGRFHENGRALARAILRDDHLADDALQDAFLTALGRLADLREPAAFPGWFRQIVRRECSRLLRRRRETTTAAIDERADPAPGPDGALQQADLRVRVRQALAQLPAATRRPLELYYFEEHTCREIGLALHLPEGTVKRRLHDARQRLRDLLLSQIPPAAGHARPTGLPL